MFFRSLETPEQAHLASALVFELSKVETLKVRVRTVSHLRNIDDSLARRVADGLACPPCPTRHPPPPRRGHASAPEVRDRTQQAYLQGRCIGILFDEGSDARIIASLSKAARKAGADVKLVAPKVGGATLSDGAMQAADGQLAGTPSAVFDAVAVVLSVEASKALSKERRAGVRQPGVGTPEGHRQRRGRPSAAEGGAGRQRCRHRRSGRRQGIPGGTPPASGRVSPSCACWPDHNDRRIVMPRGDKSAYTEKQKRQAEHIEESERDRGASEGTAERIAWATVNKQDGGGKRSGSARKGAKKATSKKAAKKAPARTSATKKATKKATTKATAAKKAPAKKAVARRHPLARPPQRRPQRRQRRRLRPIRSTAPRGRRRKEGGGYPCPKGSDTQDRSEKGCPNAEQRLIVPENGTARARIAGAGCVRSAYSLGRSQAARAPYQRDGPAVTAAEGTGTAAACSVRNAAIGMASARRCCGHQTNRNALLEPSRRAVPGKGARSPFNCRRITSPLPALWICPRAPSRSSPRPAP